MSLNISEMDIKEFNDEIVKEGIEMTIIDYIKEINKRFYQIDIDFIDDFINMVGSSECCIPHDMLFKYGVLTDHDSQDVKRLLNQYNFLEEKDYSIVSRNVAGNLKGGRPTNKYLLNPKVFKKCLIRSLKNQKYADYYLLLEDCVNYYNEYQILQLKHKINEINKNKILELEESDTLDHFVIVKSSKYVKYPYATIKGSQKNLDATLNDLELTEDNIILHLKVPSQQNFHKRIKEVLKKEYEQDAFIVKQRKYINKCNSNDIIYDVDDLDDSASYITSVTRWFNIEGISEKTFLRLVNGINKSRYNI